MSVVQLQKKVERLTNQHVNAATAAAKAIEKSLAAGKDLAEAHAELTKAGATGGPAKKGGVKPAEEAKSDEAG